jgi:hypothetical protein
MEETNATVEEVVEGNAELQRTEPEYNEDEMSVEEGGDN